MKACTKCGIEKPLSEFYTLNARPTTNATHFGECKACNIARATAWRLQRCAEDPSYNRRRRLWREYKMTLEEFDALFASQGGVCAICGGGEPRGRGFWHVDHDHESGEVRGVLCNDCNTGIGFLGDDADRLMSAAAYLLARRNVLGEVFG